MALVIASDWRCYGTTERPSGPSGPRCTLELARRCRNGTLGGTQAMSSKSLAALLTTNTSMLHTCTRIIYGAHPFITHPTLTCLNMYGTLGAAETVFFGFLNCVTSGASKTLGFSTTNLNNQIVCGKLHTNLPRPFLHQRWCMFSRQLGVGCVVHDSPKAS